MDPKKLLEKMRTAAAAMQELRTKAVNDKGEVREVTADEQTAWDAANADYDAAKRGHDAALADAQRTREIEQAEQRTIALPRTDESRSIPGREDTSGRPDGGGENRAEAPTEEQRALALQSWLCQSAVDLTDERRAAMDSCGFRVGSVVHDARLAPRPPRSQEEARALSAVTGATGGYITLPDDLIRDLEAALLSFGGLREVAQIMRTNSGNDIYWPTFDDTSNQGSIVGENTDIGDATDLALVRTKWGAYKYTTGILKVPSELFEDSPFNITAIINAALAERIARKQASDFATGDGADKPYGLVERATTGVTAAAVDAITADEVIDLIHSVDPAYRGSPNFRVACNDSVIKYIRKLKDGEGQYLWQPGLRDGTPDLLYGKRTMILQDMAGTLATGAKTMVAGDLSYYKIRDVNTVRFVRLVERYAEYDQTAFAVLMRSDGNLLDPGTHPVKRLVMA